MSVILFDSLTDRGPLISNRLGRPGPAMLFSKLEDEPNAITLEEDTALRINGLGVAGVAQFNCVEDEHA